MSVNAAEDRVNVAIFQAAYVDCAGTGMSFVQVRFPTALSSSICVR